MLPLGHAGLVTRPSLIGSSETLKTTAIVGVAALEANAEAVPWAWRSRRPDGASIRPASLRQSIDLILRPAVLDRYALALDSRRPKHDCDPSITVTALFGGERDDGGSQSCLIISHRWCLALCGSMLAKNPTRKTLGDTVLGNDGIHTGTAAGGAYQFPEAASLRISFSSVKS